ncbi:MAG: hypothetical protein JWO36_4371 [Myxococcales bacterium]|nr:hypothetical protein [Myxococcales bacterium]
MRRVIVLACAVAGCDWSLHRMQEQPRCEVNGTTAHFANGMCNQQPPEGVVAMEPPPQMPPITRELLFRGKDRFERICAPCHGVEADGNSYVAQMMTLRKPPSLVDAAAQKLADDRILTVMSTGYGLMPRYADIPATDRFAIFHFVRALQQREVSFTELPEPLQREAKQWLP